jgi:hypothetical protein
MAQFSSGSMHTDVLIIIIESSHLGQHSSRQHLVHHLGYGLFAHLATE